MENCIHMDKSDSRLTQREAEVVRLVAFGFSAKVIARQLDISPRTVDRHTETARLKLQARNRAHLVVQAIRYGIVDLQSSDAAVQQYTLAFAA